MNSDEIKPLGKQAYSGPDGADRIRATTRPISFPIFEAALTISMAWVHS